MAPILFKYANSASASPGAYENVNVRLSSDQQMSYLSPLPSEGSDHPLNARLEPMLLLGVHSFAAFECWPVRSVEHEKR